MQEFFDGDGGELAREGVGGGAGLVRGGEAGAFFFVACMERFGEERGEGCGGLRTGEKAGEVRRRVLLA